MKLEGKDFEDLRNLVYEHAGIWFEEKKLFLFQARLAERLATTGIADAREYFRHLKYSDAAKEELQCFIEVLTTNETYFFRDFPQLECFANDALPLVAEAKREAGDMTMNVWSAACSTGDEPYTLAIILKSCLDDFKKWSVRVDATDIDRNVLEAAARGVYSQRAVKDVPSVYLDEHFTRDHTGNRVNDDVRELVRFAQINLNDKQQMRQRRETYDFIFCRNVLIYFDDVGCKKVIGHLFDALKPGGFVFLGSAEQLSRFSNAFEAIKLGSRIVYRKPPALKGRRPA